METGSLYLRPPQMRDWRAWAELRALSREFLSPWEPTWPSDALTRSAFRRRIRRQLRDGQDDLGYAFFLFRRKDDALLGGMTLSNVQRGAAQSCSVGYWIGRPHARHGHMSEALTGLLGHCFGPLGLHRVEAACMPKNTASRKLLGEGRIPLRGVRPRLSQDRRRVAGSPALRDDRAAQAVSAAWIEG